jgi:hypothetical protein
VCLALVACTAKQEGKPIQDIEPERSVNTDLVYPKNPQRWAYVSARVDAEPRDRFAGFRVVVANPFAARLREEGKGPERGVKLAQFVYEARPEPGGAVPGELRRVNLIVRDPDRFGLTGGWGFASFDGAGRAIAIDAAAECITCHTTGPVTRVFTAQ